MAIFTYKNFKNVNLSNMMIITIVAICISVFLALGIFSQVHMSQQTQSDKDNFIENVKFWIGNNGIVLSMLLYTLVTLSVVLIIVTIKHIPTWSESIKVYGNLTWSRVNDVSEKITKLSNSADMLMRKVSDAIDVAIIAKK